MGYALPRTNRHTVAPGRRPVKPNPSGNSSLSSVSGAKLLVSRRVCGTGILWAMGRSCGIA